jgi:transcriptional regulator with XRE-family HTH domain
MSDTQSQFAQRLHDLRRSKGWSQPEVGKLIGTSGAIIGRYERSEMTPSIEVAKKLAEAFGVTVDYLVSPSGGAHVVQDSSMLDRIRAINELSQDEREKLLYVVDGLLRDARARRAYATA